jgi:hypothetical protein
MPTDPLPSWNECAAKSRFVDFVRRVTTEATPDFVPATDRIAVFDNDGTLWPEQPICIQFVFAFDAHWSAADRLPGHFPLPTVISLPRCWHCWRWLC